MPTNTSVSEVMAEFEELFPKIMSKNKVKNFPREAFYDIEQFLSDKLLQLIKQVQSEERERFLAELNIRAASIESTLLEYDDERLDAKGELIMELRDQLQKEQE